MHVTTDRHGRFNLCRESRQLCQTESDNTAIETLTLETIVMTLQTTLLPPVSLAESPHVATTYVPHAQLSVTVESVNSR